MHSFNDREPLFLVFHLYTILTFDKFSWWRTQRWYVNIKSNENRSCMEISTWHESTAMQLTRIFASATAVEAAKTNKKTDHCSETFILSTQSAGSLKIKDK